MAHQLTQREWEEDMCTRIFSLVHHELYLDFRYLDMALSALVFLPREELRTIATDGTALYYSPEQIIRVFRKNPLFLDRAYLHSIFHCLFRHLWMRGQREPVIWNLADIAVERLIDSFDRTSTKRALSLSRKKYYDHLEEENIPASAAAIYHDLLTITDPEVQASLQFEFYTDDHRFWPFGSFLFSLGCTGRKKLGEYRTAGVPRNGNPRTGTGRYIIADTDPD